MKKKLFTIAIALCMVFTMIPAGVFQIETAWADSGDNVGIYLRTRLVSDETPSDALTDTNIGLSTTQLEALGLVDYYWTDSYNREYWVEYGSFYSEKAAGYDHTKKDRGSAEVTALVNEIAPSTGEASATVNKEDGITFSDLNAITWDTLSWSDDGGSYSWHLNGEVRLCKISFNLNDGTSANPEDQYALYGTTLKTGWPAEPTRDDGYTFTGWYTKATGGKKITEADSLTANTTLYAQWSQDVTPSPTQSVTIAGKPLGNTNLYYHNGADGVPGTVDDDPTDANATFDPTNGTLTLHNLDVTTAEKGIQWTGNYDLTIFLEEGTENKVVSTASGAIGGDDGMGSSGPSLTIKGDGILEATGADSASGIWVWKNITIKEDVTVYATGGANGIANNATSGKITIDGNAKVIASGGTYGIGYSYSNANTPEIKGGALVVSGGTAAMREAPSIADTFDNIRAGANQDGTGAAKITANDITDETVKTYKYLKIVKGHTHCICGETHHVAGDHKRIELVTFKAWDDTTAEAQELACSENLPKDAGNYYLTGNVGLKEKWQPAAGTVLCLNGNTIQEADPSKQEPTTLIYIANDNISVTSCEGNAKIKNGAPTTCDGIMVNAGNTFNLYNVTVATSNNENSGNENSGGVYNYGTFNMYSGAIQGNAGVEGVCNESVFNMYGGSIIENQLRSHGYGGFLNKGTLNLSGDVNITGNTKGGTPTNITLVKREGSNASIHVVGELSPSARIGISLYPEPADGATVTVVEAPSAQYAENFFADDAKYEIVADADTDTLVLKEKQCTITWDANGGKFADNSIQQKAGVKAGESVTAPTENPTKETDDRYTYTFEDWYTEAEGGTQVTDFGNVTADATYYAHYTQTPRVYNVTFNLDEGTLPEGTDPTYTYGTAVTLPTPTKAGYNFDGWYDNEGFNDNPITEIAATETGDKEFWAKWTLIPVQAPTITEQPTNVTMRYGDTGQSFSVTATAASDVTVSYQWYRNTTNSYEGGIAISDATEATYNILDNPEVGTYYYYCEVKATKGTASASAKTDVVTLTVNKAAGGEAPTGLTPTAPSKWGRSDGTITGVNSTMEYADNALFENAKDCTDSTITGLAAGTYYVRVKASDNYEASKAATVIVPVGETEVESIAVTSTTHKTQYFIGEELDVNGLVITATMTDSTTQEVPVTAAMISHFDTSVEGNKTITITYEGKTTTYGITISKRDFSGIEAASYSGEYDGQAHTITFTGLPEGATVSYGNSEGSYTESAISYTDFTNGAKTVYYKISMDGYNDMTGSATVTIEKCDVTIKVDAKSKVEGSADPEFTGSISGLVSETDLGTVTYERLAADAGKEKVGDDITITAKYTENSNYEVTVETAKLTITEKPSTGGGSSTQKPTIIADEGANASLNYNGSRLTITAKDGYEITDVLVNGVSKGAVAEITGLKTGDKVEVKTAKKAEPTDPAADNNAKLIKGVENTTIVLKSKLTKNGKVLLTWTKSKGYKVDKFEFYRSVKKNSGYGKAAFFTTKDGSWSKYLNTKNLKAGKTYYYKVRGVRVIDGQKYYTQWSNKAWRTVK